MKPRYSRMILRVLYDSLYLTRNMDVFDKYYHTYRIVLKIIGLWPYNNSVYVWIQRLCISALFLGNIIFQVTKIIIFICGSYNCICKCCSTCTTFCPMITYNCINCTTFYCSFFY